MDVQEYIKKLANGKADNLSVKKMKKIMELFGNPQDKLKYIHVTGTNGKGSIIEMLNSILTKTSLKIGKFISPHLIRYNERISINNQNIQDEQMQELYEELQQVLEKEKIEISFFEFFTIIAILYFYKQNVDIVLMEVGLGGLYDSTNVIYPMISVISSVGYDHMQVLGNTLEEIAKQKAGIIKENSTTVYVEQKSKIDKIIINTCRKKQNKLHLIPKEEMKNIKFENGFEIFDYKQYHNIEVNLKGKIQIQNSAIALECCDILKKIGYTITEEAIRIGLKTVVHKARFETICKDPTIIFDGGHNEQAIRNLKETIQIYYKNSKKIYVISVLKSKDYEKILDDIIEENSIYILTNGNDSKRYTDNNLMYEYAKKINKSVEIYKMELKEAIQFCKENKEHVSFITGSFYIYGDTIRLISY